MDSSIDALRREDQELTPGASAALEVAAAAAALDAETRDDDQQEEEPDVTLEPEDLPDDCYPLVVCKTQFVPPKGTRGSLLALEAGDLARVTSLLDAAMYFGFVENRPTERGWFPRRNVTLL